MFDRAKNLFELKKRLDELKKFDVVVEKSGIRVVMRGDQEVKEVVLDGEKSDRLKDVFNKALKESRKKAAKRMPELQEMIKV